MAARRCGHRPRHRGTRHRRADRYARPVSCNAWLDMVRQRRRRYTVGMLEFTAVYKKVAEGYVAYVEELPGANTQGDTLDEARENLKEAVELVLESNRALAREDAGNDDLIREPLRLATG